MALHQPCIMCDGPLKLVVQEAQHYDEYYGTYTEYTQQTWVHLDGEEHCEGKASVATPDVGSHTGYDDYEQGE